MSFLNDARALKVWFDEDSMWVSLADGRVLSVPKVWFPKFLAASEEELMQYEMSGNGLGIHWDHLDEDISVQALLEGHRSRVVL